MNPCRIHTQEHHHDSNLVVYCYTFDQLLTLIFTDQFAGIRVICTRSSSSISAVDVSMVMILTSIVGLSLVPCKMFLIHINHNEFSQKILSLPARRRSHTTTSWPTGGSTVTQTWVKAWAFICQCKWAVRIGEVIKECTPRYSKANCSKASVSKGGSLKGTDKNTKYFIIFCTTFAGLRGIAMYCHPGHLRLGLLVNWSFSASWSGI